MPRKHSPRQQSLYEQELSMIVTKTEKKQHNGYTSYHVLEKKPITRQARPTNYKPRRRRRNA